MPYIIEIVRAGNTIEVSKYYSSRFNKRGIGRGKRKSLTTKEQREVNKRAAEKKLRRLINENFQEGDTHLVLDYKLSERPTGREGMRADADDFLKEMRKLYKSLGLKDRLKDMTEEEQLTLLATDGMLVKRPLIVADDYVLTGFREKEWEDKLG